MAAPSKNAIKKQQPAADVGEGTFPLLQALKLIGIGCCLTAITNFPSAFMVSLIGQSMDERKHPFVNVSSTLP
jgi:hypothetical protein